MSLQVPAPADSRIRSADAKAALKPGKTLDNRCYYLWLEWLQRLLHAESLVLFRCEKSQKSTAYYPSACLPDNAVVSSSKMQLIQRCASEKAVVCAKLDNKSGASIVCIPDVPGEELDQPSHILLIKRSEPISLEMQTQVKLVRWAFDSISVYEKNVVPQVSRAIWSPDRLISWCVSQVGKEKPLSQTLAGLMNELQTLLVADSCYVARLHIRKQRVRKVSLLAISGKRKIDSRLPVSDTVLCAVHSAYAKKPLPLANNYETNVMPCMAEQMAINESGKFCNRLIIPLDISGQYFAVTMECRNRTFTDHEQIRLCAELRSCLFVLLCSDPKTLGLTATLKRAVSGMISQISKHVSRTLLIMPVALALLIFLLIPAEHRVSARLSVEASEHQVLIAPVDGFVKSVKAKAGDKIAEGEVLATLDDVDLQLQQQSLTSEFQQNQQAYARSLANQDRIEITSLKEEAALIETRLAQLAIKQERMVIKAPIDGVVLSGSWDDFEGASVAAGDTLFTIGSTSKPRLVLNVSEYDVGMVAIGHAVAIRMSASPSIVHAGTVTKVLPIAMPSEGKNTIQVHAMMDRNTALRPGMLGIGKVLVGKQSRLRQWYERGLSRIVWLAWKTGVLK